jgi:hypothetical protein
MRTKKADILTFDQLTDEMRACMDRAVRAARDQGFCNDFSRIAAVTFGVATSDVRDSDGFTCDGYDRDGFNREGWDRNGYGRDGFSPSGYNREGYDKEGFNRDGLNKDGLDRNGRDKYRFDRNGLDQEGYDGNGRRHRADREWYAQQAARPAERFHYDRDGYNRPS